MDRPAIDAAPPWLLRSPYFPVPVLTRTPRPTRGAYGHLDLPSFVARQVPQIRTIRRICEALGVQAGEVTEFAAALREQAEPGEAEAVA
jgi:hypothetical protein